MKIIININSFQDSIEAIEHMNAIQLWHNYNGKDILLNTFDLEHEQEEQFLIDYSLEFIENFYSDNYTIELF